MSAIYISLQPSPTEFRQARDQLKQLLRNQDDQLNVHKRELREASLEMHKNEVVMVKMKEDKLVLERRLE